MIRTQEATGKTVDEARTNACALLGVEKDDINVSYEVLEMPQKTGFLGLKLTPAKVRVSVELPDEPAAAPAAPVEEPAPVVEEKAAPVAAEPVVEETAPEAPAAVEEPAAPAAEGEEVEVPINIEENAKVKAAVDYLKDVIEKMGVQDVKFSAVQKGEATIIRLDGEKMGALIGRQAQRWPPSWAAGARRWRACPIWQASWQTASRATTSSWASTWPATATSARAT